MKMEGSLVVELLILSILALCMDFTSGMVIQSTWSHVRFKSLPPTRLDAREGGDLILECAVSGSPAPQVSWYKDSMFVSHRDWKIEDDISSIGVTVARIKISCVTQKDVGVYECRARSGGHEVSATTKVNVVKNDVVNTACVLTGRPEISMWRETLLVEEGDTARLPCRVQDTALDYRTTWTDMEGKSADQDKQKFTIQENGDLVIRDTSFADMGQYTCTVSGTGGTQSIHTFVYALSRDRNSLN